MSSLLSKISVFLRKSIDFLPKEHIYPISYIIYSLKVLTYQAMYAIYHLKYHTFQQILVYIYQISHQTLIFIGLI